jgi:hypothetical protein
VYVGVTQVDMVWTRVLRVDDGASIDLVESLHRGDI